MVRKIPKTEKGRKRQGLINLQAVRDVDTVTKTIIESYINEVAVTESTKAQRQRDRYKEA